MGPEILPWWKVLTIALFFLFFLAFIFFGIYRIFAGPPKLSIQQLINRKIINISTLNDIYLSQIGGRLTINKFSYPLQYYNKGYRRMFNAYLSTVLGDIRNTSACQGKVDYLTDKGFKIDFVRLILFVSMLLIYALAHWAYDLPSYIDLSLYIPLMAISLFPEGKKWKLSDDSIQYRDGLIELKKITEMKLSIPEKKLYFELELNSKITTYLIRDSKLKRLIPIIAIINDHHFDSSKMNV